MKCPEGLRVRNGFYWVEHAYVDSFGKRVRLQKTTGVRADGQPTAETAAILRKQEILREAFDARPEKALLGAGTLTVADALKANLAAKRRKQRAERTIAICLQVWRHITQHIPDTTLLAAVDEAMLERYADARMTTGDAVSSIRRELIELRFGMRKLRVRVPEMPDLPESAARERTLTIDESRALIAAARGRRDHLVMYRMLGIRRGELFSIDPGLGDVNLELGMLRVHGKKSQDRDERGWYRWLPMPDAIREIVERRLTERHAQGLPLFEPWDQSSMIRDLVGIARRAGLADPHICFNDLRRSFCTELLLGNESTKIVSTLMGHTSTRMVDKVYGRLFGRTRELAATMAKVTAYGKPRP